MEETWKGIPNYEGFYQVSDLGNVKSLKRVVNHKRFGKQKVSEKILKPLESGGYNYSALSKDDIIKQIRTSQLVMMAFRGHVPFGHELIVDHINNIKTDDRLENLQLISQRLNASKDKKNKSSKYTGVHWRKDINKWQAQIHINRKKKHLGYFTDEKEASQAYQNELSTLNVNVLMPC